MRCPRRCAVPASGKPIENAFVESFNGKFRDECLNEHWFTSVAEAQRIIEPGAWITTPYARTVRCTVPHPNNLPTLSVGARRRRRRLALTGKTRRRRETLNPRTSHYPCSGWRGRSAQRHAIHDAAVHAKAHDAPRTLIHHDKHPVCCVGRRIRVETSRDSTHVLRVTKDREPGWTSRVWFRLVTRAETGVRWPPL